MEEDGSSKLAYSLVSSKGEQTKDETFGVRFDDGPRISGKPNVVTLNLQINSKRQKEVAPRPSQKVWLSSEVYQHRG